jgi:hypothetical protein
MSAIARSGEHLTLQGFSAKSLGDNASKGFEFGAWFPAFGVFIPLWYAHARSTT